jgi:hypothetical protein
MVVVERLAVQVVLVGALAVLVALLHIQQH